MPVSPSGNLSIHLVALQYMLASTPAFQTWVGAVSAAAALPRVHLFEMDDTPDGANTADARPRALMMPGPDFVLQDAGVHEWRIRGSVLLLLEEYWDRDETADPNEAFVGFLNHVSDTIDGMKALEGTTSGMVASGACHPVLQSVGYAMTPQLADQVEQRAMGQPDLFFTILRLFTNG